MKLDEDLGSLQELLQRIFDTVPFMITIYDPNTNVLRVNRAFERLTGWSSNELATVSLMDKCYPDPEYREQARQYMQSLPAGVAGLVRHHP
jgi:PAS domain S-box-containing protein